MPLQMIKLCVMHKRLGIMEDIEEERFSKMGL
jgi:hypothetical protein